MGQPLIAFSQQSAAHLLANYLSSQSIPANVVQHSAATDGNEFVVVIANVEHTEKAQQIAEAFIKNPTDQNISKQRGTVARMYG